MFYWYANNVNSVGQLHPHLKTMVKIMMLNPDFHETLHIGKESLLVGEQKPALLRDIFLV